ncbi:TPA: M48 family metalloprotease [Escherichia coli]|nr:M48 family metalloprotease [Escherichia coli]HAJ7014304.1 hypothetical protein [Escherichia coli]HAM5590948.1 M48 family metalloprotease [Escherichia coli]HAM7149253.1 M48 family metalloprotease [Escherichia coli]
MSDPNGLTWAATLVSLAVAIPTAGHAVIYKRDPRSATLWVLLIALLPLGGSLLYGLFGINRYQRRARRLFPGADPAVRQDLSPTIPEAVSPPLAGLALLGQLAIVLSLPALLLGVAEVNWPALLLLAVAPQLALLAQLGLSRVREFDADRLAAELTGDPHGLASALAKIERVSRSWRAWLLPGWGNPEPSWLRTHPATAERIERLLELAPPPAMPPFPSARFVPEVTVSPRPPRWRTGGLWR